MAKLGETWVSSPFSLSHDLCLTQRFLFLSASMTPQSISDRGNLSPKDRRKRQAKIETARKFPILSISLHFQLPAV
jgi:hypothetical protein